KQVDSQHRPETIKVELLTNGESEDRTQEISKGTDWKYNFTDLAKYDKQGEEIEYTIQEIEIPAGYEAVVDGYNITNTQKSTEVYGESVGNEVNSQYRPETITVELLTNGESEDRTQEISKETDWKYNFTDLAKYDKQGEEIEYTIQEIEIPAGYEAVVDGYNITNTQKSTEVSGEKTWNEVDSQYRPETITVELLTNGE